MDPYPSQEQEARQRPFQQYSRPPFSPSTLPLGQRQKSLLLIPAISCLLAFLGFMLPYFATYSGQELASLYGLYWVEPVFLVAAVCLLVIALVSSKKRWARGVIGVGAVAAFLHFQIVNMHTTLTYWGIGAWLFLIGMIGIVISGVYLLLRASAPQIGNQNNRRTPFK